MEQIIKVVGTQSKLVSKQILLESRLEGTIFLRLQIYIGHAEWRTRESLLQPGFLKSRCISKTQSRAGKNIPAPQRQKSQCNSRHASITKCTVVYEARARDHG